MTKHTPSEMKASDRSLWGDTPFCSQVRMARIVEHSPMNGMDADHLANEFAKRWNCHNELVAAVKAAKEMSDWFMEHSRQADHAHSELGQPLHETSGWKELVDAGYNGLMASYHGQFEEAIAKAKGGAA